ncbi:Phycocyanobilin:Cys-153 beta-phycocyanin lyase CpcT [Gracilaria domingensis]|nr:Phycocyanobilin:Cys-153 beta-phycocyanin lyase CpcT [Gracilaria domingensis]
MSADAFACACSTPPPRTSARSRPRGDWTRTGADEQVRRRAAACVDGVHFAAGGADDERGGVRAEQTADGAGRDAQRLVHVVGGEDYFALRGAERHERVAVVLTERVHAGDAFVDGNSGGRAAEESENANARYEKGACTSSLKAAHSGTRLRLASSRAEKKEADEVDVGDGGGALRGGHIVRCPCAVPRDGSQVVSARTARGSRRERLPQHVARRQRATERGGGGQRREVVRGEMRADELCGVVVERMEADWRRHCGGGGGGGETGVHRHRAPTRLAHRPCRAARHVRGVAGGGGHGGHLRDGAAAGVLAGGGLVQPEAGDGQPPVLGAHSRLLPPATVAVSERIQFLQRVCVRLQPRRAVQDVGGEHCERRERAVGAGVVQNLRAAAVLDGRLRTAATRVAYERYVAETAGRLQHFVQVAAGQRAVSRWFTAGKGL